MNVTLRCQGRIFGVFDPDKGTLEVHCPRSGCGKTKHNVVLHTIDVQTGETISTKTFANPRMTTDKE